jgi:hypothetical protein
VREGKVGPGKIEALYDEQYPWKKLATGAVILALVIVGMFLYRYVRTEYIYRKKL